MMQGEEVFAFTFLLLACDVSFTVELVPSIDKLKDIDNIIFISVIADVLFSA